MHSVSLDIDAPAHVAWRLLIDTAEWPGWGPSVRAVDVPDRLIGPGMRGRVQTTLGLWLPFEITAWQAGEAWAWRVAGIDATGHRVEPLDPDRCRVSFLIPRWAPLYRPVCQSALRRIAKRVESVGID
ncbi:MAG: SRPBCC family protein [Thiohalocapsa sp.]